MHISSINIIYAIKNVPCPCTCHMPFHLDPAVALALVPTQRESPVGLTVSEREHMVRVMQLFPGTPAACALCRGTHSGSGHLITVHR